MLGQGYSERNTKQPTNHLPQWLGRKKYWGAGVMASGRTGQLGSWHRKSRDEIWNRWKMVLYLGHTKFTHTRPWKGKWSRNATRPAAWPSSKLSVLHLAGELTFENKNSARVRAKVHSRLYFLRDIGGHKRRKIENVGQENEKRCVWGTDRLCLQAYRYCLVPSVPLFPHHGT